MATIRQLPSGKWNAQVRIKGQTARSATFPTQEAAQQWAKQTEASTKEHKTHTIYSLGMTYCESRLKGRGSYHHSLMLVEQLGVAFPQPIHDITPKQVNEFKQKRLKKVKPATCRSQLAFMSRCFRYAKRELLIDVANPLEDIALPQPSRSSDKVVSKGELTLLLNELTPLMAIIAELAYETAMRRSEIVGLTPSCVHLDERIADVIDGKNGTRSVPLTLRAIELLKQAMSKPLGPKERLFKLRPASVSVAMKRARDRAGLDSTVRLHQLRHTRITNVAKIGFNNAQIMVVSGHRDTRSVARYSHLNAKDVISLLD